MPTQRLLHIRKLALGNRLAHQALCAQTRLAQIVMVRDVEIVSRRLLEPLQAAPRHVLDCHQRAVVQQHVIEFAVRNDCAVKRVDDAGDDFPGRLRRGVGVEDAVGALGPGLDRRVNGGLDVAAVEVDFSAWRQVVEGAGEAEGVPEERAGGCDCVDVEAGVCVENGVKDVLPEGTAFCFGVVGWGGEFAGGGESEVFLHVFGVAAGVGASVDVVHEALVEVEETSPLVDVGDRGDVGQEAVVGYAGVVEHDALDIVVC